MSDRLSLMCLYPIDENEQNKGEAVYTDKLWG